MRYRSTPAVLAVCPLLRPVAAVCLGLLLLTVGGCGRSDTPDEKDEQANNSQTDDRQRPPVSEPATAEEVLERMVAAYQKASSYADRGTLRFLLEPDPDGIGRTVPFSLVLARPDKIRLEMYEAKVVSDGTQLRATLDSLPGQVLARPAPKELSIASVCNERITPPDLVEVIAGVPPQLMLLLEKGPLELLLQGAGKPQLIEPEKIGPHDCYRVRMRLPEGTGEFWVDRQTYALRRFVFPTDAMRKSIEQQKRIQLEAISLVADFENARLDEKIDAKVFRLQTPAGAEPVSFFVPPNPAQLLGKRVPDFRFVDLAGTAVTPESLAGKPVVLGFWESMWKPSLDGLPGLNKVAQQYRRGGKITVLAVSVDRPEVENETLREVCGKLGIEIPIVRDLNGAFDATFRTKGLPAVFILDGQGVVQDYLIGPSPATLPAMVSETLDKLLAGQDTYHQPLKIYQDRLKAYEQLLDSGGEIPQTEIAQRSDPQTFRLVPLFKFTGTKGFSPGNVLAVPSAEGQPKLLVVDQYHWIVELGLDGKQIGNHELDLDPQQEAVTTLRAATAADGKQYYLAFAFSSAQQRCHLLDEKLDILTSYPKDALENPHAGIGDVQLFDLDGDGKLNLYVGYWGDVGVQAASLEGERLWRDRSVANVQQIAVAGPDDQQRHLLLCVDTSDSVTGFDANGRAQGKLTLPGRFLTGVASADLDADGRREVCALALDSAGKNLALGLDLIKGEIWSYPLSSGVHQCPIERIVAGRITPEGPGQWLLPGADGSIRIVAADGKLLDQFNYGEMLTGLATTELDGQPVLVVSSPNAVEAWKIEKAE